MRKTIFEVGVAVAAAALALLLTSWLGPVNATWKWIVVGAAAVVTFLAAWLAHRKPAADNRGAVEIGNRIQADEDVEVSDVEIASGTDGGRVGNDLHAGRNAKVSKIRLGDQDDRKSKP